ncbi:GAF domain-containing protein [Alishewanella sp. HL-SH05]|uniref:GAF domain-containing protein n=1 Tax=Alishewanella sp. HL-SH05 TaxID=3461145 RepID=UPI004040FA37
MAEFELITHKHSVLIAKLLANREQNIPRYERILRLAQALFNTPFISLSLVHDEIFYRFAELGQSAFSKAQIARLCAATLTEKAVFVLTEPQNITRPVKVSSEMHEMSMQFYAGVPIFVQGQHTLGILYLIDHQPRVFSDEAKAQLVDLADILAEEFASDLISEQIHKINKVQMVSESIARVQSDFILEDDRKAAFARVLNDILQITDSGYGFVGEVLYDEQGAPYLKTFALTNIAWDEASQRFYDEHAPVGLEFRNLQSIFGYTLRTKQVMITNDPTTNPHSCGIPKGHPPLNCYLGLPIFFDNQLIAMIGLANKVGGYHEEDVEFLRPFLTTIGQLVYATRIKRQQKQVKQQLKNIVEASEIGTWTLDLETELLEVNPRWLEMLGYQPNELPQVTLSWMRNNMHKDDLLASRESVRLHLEGIKDFYESQFRIRHKKGYWVWIQARGRIMVDSEQSTNFSKLYGINIDITREKLLQNQLSHLAEHVPGMVYQFKLNPDQSSSFPYVGPAVEKLLGFTADQLATEGALVFSKVHPEDLKVFYESLNHSAATLQQWSLRFRISAKGANYRWLAGQSSPEIQDDGAIIWHGYIQDVTEETEMQLTLEAAKAQAELAVATKSSFLANMSHEIRTPMNGVIGMLDILAENNTDAKQTESISLMRESAYSLLTIIDDILDFSKLEAGKLNIAKEPLMLEPVIEQICNMLDYLALKSNVELTCYVDPAIDTQIMFDPNRVRQILVNLLSNAIKFSSKLDRTGQVRLAVTLADKQQDQALIDFTITDNGIGMAPDVVEKLFQPFTQADDSTSRKYGGTGLGLAITHQLVQLMQGIITAESTPSIGSTFKVSLPVEMCSNKDLSRTKHLNAIEVVILGESKQQQLVDYASYLTAAGATISWMPITKLTVDWLTKLEHRVVWLFDNVYSQGDSLVLIDKIKQYCEENSRFVVLGRGRRRKTRRTGPDSVKVDVNVLQRSQLIQAVHAAFHDADLAQDVEQIHQPVFTQQHSRILVLEDNSTNQKVIKQQLQRLGYSVVVAEDGLTGLRCLEKQQFDLILSDLHMPNMDGYQFVKKFRQQELEQGRTRIPVIALTANIVPEELLRCKDEGMDDYLVKPLPSDQLKATLDTWLNSKSEKNSMDPKLQTQTAEPRVINTNTIDFDISVLAETVGEESVTEILQDYACSLDNAIAKLEQAMIVKDFATASAEAHKLKSSSRFVGATELGDVFAIFEQASKAAASNNLNHKEQINDIYQTLIATAAVVMEQLNNYLK